MALFGEFAQWLSRLPTQPDQRAAQLRFERVGIVGELTEALYRPRPRADNGPERPGEPLPVDAPWYTLMEAYRAQLLQDAARSRALSEVLLNSQTASLRRKSGGHIRSETADCATKYGGYSYEAPPLPTPSPLDA